MEKKKLIKNKIVDTLPMLYLETFILMFLGQLLGGLVIGVPMELGFMLNTKMRESAFLNTAYMYVIFLGIWAVTIFWILIKKRNRPIIQAIGTKPQGNHWKYLLLGTVLGFAMNGCCILVAWLHKDIALTYDAFHLASFIGIFVTVFIQSSAEELLCRGFLYQKLRRSYQKPVVAIVGNSLFFAVLHLFNDGVTILSLVNIFLVGILFSLLVYYMDSIWCAFALHTAWNFTQNIIFGLPNSGMTVPYSVFKLDAATAANSFAYDVGFGIEGTIFADIVLLAACIIIYLWGRKHGKQAYNVWSE